MQIVDVRVGVGRHLHHTHSLSASGFLYFFFAALPDGRTLVEFVSIFHFALVHFKTLADSDSAKMKKNSTKLAGLG